MALVGFGRLLLGCLHRVASVRGALVTPWGTCQVCERTTAAHNHHRKRRSQGGDSSPENLMEVCASCHDYIHSHVEQSYEKGWLVQSWDEPKPLERSEEHEHEGKCDRCGIEIKPRTPRKRFTGEARRKRRTISIKVPTDTEDGGAIWDENMEDIKALLVADPDGPYDEGDNPPNFESVICVCVEWREWKRASLRARGIHA